MPERGQAPEPEASTADEHAETPGESRGRLEILGIVIAALLTVGVVVAALDMKFEADQARWQQRQTCLQWYQLQAEYGVGPWFDELPAAAADCGGGETDDGTPTVPGGGAPALDPADLPDELPTDPTTGGSVGTTTTPSTAPAAAP